VVTPASAYRLDLPRRFGAICHISCTVCGALKTQSTDRQRLGPYFTWLHTASSPPPGYTSVFMSGLGTGGWPNAHQVPLHLSHVLPPSQPSPALQAGKAVAVAHSYSGTGQGWEAARGPWKVTRGTACNKATGLWRENPHGS